MTGRAPPKVSLESFTLGLNAFQDAALRVKQRPEWTEAERAVLARFFVGIIEERLTLPVQEPVLPAALRNAYRIGALAAFEAMDDVLRLGERTVHPSVQRFRTEFRNAVRERSTALLAGAAKALKQARDLDVEER